MYTYSYYIQVVILKDVEINAYSSSEPEENSPVFGVMVEGTHAAVKRRTPQLSTIQISLKRMGHTIQCLLIGKCAVYMPIFVPYDAPRYIGNEVASNSLNTRLENISRSLSWCIDKITSKIYKLPNASYIHTYLSTINCSSATITMTKGFFTFSQELETLPQTSTFRLNCFPLQQCRFDLAGQS